MEPAHPDKSGALWTPEIANDLLTIAGPYSAWQALSTSGSAVRAVRDGDHPVGSIPTTSSIRRDPRDLRHVPAVMRSRLSEA